MRPPSTPPPPGVIHLYIFRHARAAKPESRFTHDAERPLTDEGRAKFEKAVAGMHRLGLTFERVLHSPYVRSEQTARLLEPLVYGSIHASELLAQPPSQALLDLLASYDHGPVCLVGHQPWLSSLVAWLALGDPMHGERIELKKGGLVLLEGHPSPAGMQLRALVPPRLLRRIE